MTHMYFSAPAEGRISYGHLGRTDSCSNNVVSGIGLLSCLSLLICPRIMLLSSYSLSKAYLYGKQRRPIKQTLKLRLSSSDKFTLTSDHQCKCSCVQDLVFIKLSQYCSNIDNCNVLHARLASLRCIESPLHQHSRRCQLRNLRTGAGHRLMRSAVSILRIAAA